MDFTQNRSPFTSHGIFLAYILLKSLLGVMNIVNSDFLVALRKRRIRWLR